MLASINVDFHKKAMSIFLSLQPIFPYFCEGKNKAPFLPPSTITASIGKGLGFGASSQGRIQEWGNGEGGGVTLPSRL